MKARGSLSTSNCPSRHSTLTVISCAKDISDFVLARTKTDFELQKRFDVTALLMPIRYALVKSFCLKSASNATCFSINTYMAQPDKHMFNGSIRCCTTLLWVEHDFAPKTILV